MKSKFTVITILLMSSALRVLAACSSNPGALTISVESGASAGTPTNYYVVPLPVGSPTTVVIRAGGETPCPTTAEECSCPDPESSVQPTEDGPVIYTFSNSVGTQDASDSSKLTWTVNSSHATGEFKFKVTKAEQKYEACDSDHPNGGVASKSNTQESIEITILVCKVDMQFASASACDGTSVNVDLLTNPTSLASSDLSGGSFTFKKPDGSTNFTGANPSNSASQMVLRGSDNKQWKVDNVKWFSTQADQCNDTSQYKVTGVVNVKGVAVPIAEKLFTASATLGAGNCLNGNANINNVFSGQTASLTIVHNPTTGNYEARLSSIGNFRRDVQSTSSWTVPANSQYFNQVKNEEIYHETQQHENASHHLLQNCWIALNIYNAFKAGEPYTGATAIAAQGAAVNAWNQALSAENARSSALFGSYTCALEKEAKNSAGSSHRVKLKCTYTNCP